MERTLIISGLGGQGILIAGELLGRAACLEGREALFFEFYGGEVRGSDSEGLLAVGTEEIAAPPVIPQRTDAVMAMHERAFKRYESLLKPGGIMLVNNSVVKDAPSRKDITYLLVPVTQLALEAGNAMVQNMIAVGAFVEASKLVSLDSVKAALTGTLPERRHKYIPANQEALAKGAEFVRANGKVILNSGAQTLFGGEWR